jgi:SEC-C motif-containing protein
MMAAEVQILDFVRPEERDEYLQLVVGLRAQLRPVGALEEVFAEAIVGATWRLRRCSMLEARMAETLAFDPMEDDSAGRVQASVDRARVQSHNILRRSMAELRQIQTERSIRHEVFGPNDTADRDLTSYREFGKFLTNHDRGKLLARKLHAIGTRPASQPQPAQLASFCETPRNALCPCASGRKYKRCCGQSAPPVLQRAA